MPKNDFIYDVSARQDAAGRNCRIDLCQVPMRDGVRLSTIVYRPDDAEAHQVVLTRTPYDHRDRLNVPQRYYLDRGQIFVFQSCRGNGFSEGTFHPFVDERSDAADTIAWIKAQPWFGGRLAMTGGSYSGLTQWLAAIDAAPELVAITPTVSCSNVHDKLFIGGAFFLQLHMHWGMSMNYRSRFGNAGLPDWDGVGLARHLPLLEMDEAAGLGPLEFWREWILKRDEEDHWEPWAVNHCYERITAPVYMTGGWYDFYTDGTLENFTGMRTRGGSETARRFTRCVIGPWGHTGLINPELFGAENTPAAAEQRLARFRDNLLLAPTADPLPDEPPLRYFVMGKNEWRSAAVWPPPGVVEQCFYLHAAEGANTRYGDGRIDLEKPEREPADVYLYNPRDPVPSRGGCFLGPGKNGCVDQRDVEERSDVLVYISAPLAEELEIAGRVRVRLFAATAARDTDFTAKLVDIHPDGRALNVCDGIIRARYRHGGFVPALPEKDRVYEYVIDCWHTAHCFLPGHRLGVDISSSNFPRFDRNPNTGKPFGIDGEMKTARQTIYHDSDRPSGLILPVVSKTDGPDGRPNSIY